MKRVLDWRALLLAIWIVVLCVPTLRLLLSQQVRNDRYEGPNPPFSLLRNFPRTDVGSLSRKETAARFPDDLETQVEVENERLADVQKRYVTDGNALRGEAYAAVYRRFPREKWLLDQALQNLMATMLRHRQRGAYSKEVNQSPPSPDAIQRVLQLSAEGQKLQPQNSFYDVCRAIALYALWRDEEASKTVQSASRKPFDDGTIQMMRARLRTREKKEALLYEDRLSVYSAQLFPAYAVFRQMGRVAVAQANGEEARGDAAKALQIYVAVARLGGQMRDTKGPTILSLVGRAIQENAWRRGIWPSKTSVSSGGALVRITEAGRLFATYSSTRNRPDLAREALSQSQKSVWVAQQIVDSWRENQAFGSATNMLQRILKWKNVGTVLLSQIQFTIVCWLFACLCIAYLQRARAKNNDGENDDLSEENSNRGVNWAICLGVLAGALGLFALWRFDMNNWLISLASEISSAPYNALAASWISLAIVASPLLVSAFVLVLLARRQTKKAATEKRRREPKTQSDAQTASHLPLSQRDLAPFFKPFVPYFLVALALAFALIIWPFLPDLSFETVGAEWLLCGLMLLVFLFSWWLLRARSGARFGALATFRHLRRALGMAIIVSSAAYLSSSLAALPMRKQADAELSAIVQNGEMAVVLARATSASSTQLTRFIAPTKPLAVDAAP